MCVFFFIFVQFVSDRTIAPRLLTSGLGEIEKLVFVPSLQLNVSVFAFFFLSLPKQTSNDLFRVSKMTCELQQLLVSPLLRWDGNLCFDGSCVCTCIWSNAETYFLRHSDMSVYEPVFVLRRRGWGSEDEILAGTSEFLQDLPWQLPRFFFLVDVNA